MLQVQLFERALALALLVSEHREANEHRTEKPLLQAAFRRRMTRSLMRTTHLLNRASASEVRKDLEGKIDDKLLSEIDPPIAWRDFLAHRYLAVRVTRGSQLEPWHDHVNELADLAEDKAFRSVTLRLGELVTGVADQISAEQAQREDGAPEVLREAIHDTDDGLPSAAALHEGISRGLSHSHFRWPRACSVRSRRRLRVDSRARPRPD